MNSRKIRLYLASGSPRRREILEQLGFQLERVHADVDETVQPGEDAVGYTQRLAAEKAAAGWSVAIREGERTEIATSCTDVTFKPLTDAEIERYLDTGEPFDKAGAYGIQGKASVFVQHISGSFTGVVGLPVFETAQLLAAFDITLP